MSHIVLKFDDLNQNTLPHFQSLHRHCYQLNIPVCYGLIGESLSNPSKDYLSSLLQMMDENVELWNHGFYHTEAEFSSAFAQQQEESIQATQDLMKRHLCKASVTFGSPHNNSTEKTVGVLSRHFPEIKNYFYMADGSGVSSARQLLMRCNYEITTGVVDLDFFRREYDRIGEYPYFVMQGHPSFWRDEDFGRFKEMLNVLINDGNEFVTSEQLREIDISGYVVTSSDKWIKSLESFFASHRKVYFYGAGEIGREVYRFMSLRGFKPDAFVVSDGKRDVVDVCGIPVFELSEIKGQAADYGIVPTILGRTHGQVFGNSVLSEFDIWMPGDAGDIEEYNKFVDFVRYELSCHSWHI